MYKPVALVALLCQLIAVRHVKLSDVEPVASGELAKRIVDLVTVVLLVELSQEKRCAWNLLERWFLVVVSDVQASRTCIGSHFWIEACAWT